MASHSREVSSPPTAVHSTHNVLVHIPKQSKGVTERKITFTLSGIRRPNAIQPKEAAITFLFNDQPFGSVSHQIEPSSFFDHPPREVTVDIDQNCTFASGKTLRVVSRHFNLTALASTPLEHLVFDFSTAAMKKRISIYQRTGPLLDSSPDERSAFE